MIGNDIIDLQLAKKESNWKRKGYLSKLYSPTEQELILSASYPDQMVWVLWSMKEAAYKIVHRKTMHRSYNPKAFNCTIKHINKNQINGLVTYRKNQFETSTTCSNLFVHTISTEKPRDLTTITSFFGTSSSNLHIQKDLFGVPFIYDNQNNKIPISVSHHGDFRSVVLVN